MSIGNIAVLVATAFLVVLVASGIVRDRGSRRKAAQVHRPRPGTGPEADKEALIRIGMRGADGANHMGG